MKPKSKNNLNIILPQDIDITSGTTPIPYLKEIEEMSKDPQWIKAMKDLKKKEKKTK